MRKLCTIFLAIGLAQLVSAEKPHPNERHTAQDANYLSPLEKEVIAEINLFRSNPGQYAQLYIAPLAQYYDKKILHYPGDQSIRTIEGVKALHECVRVLQKAAAIPLLHPNEKLSNAARDHQLDQQNTGKTGHAGSDGSNLKQRIERYGKWKIRLGENIAYGNTSARQIVVFLLIDDGVKNRGHRTTLLNPDFKLVGVACGAHPVYKTMCVLDFAGGIEPESSQNQ